jgi:hypothetical protein
MRYLLLLIAPALSLNASGIVQTNAGALACGAVMRASDQVQTYCYAPGLKLIHNTIDTLTPTAMPTVPWCTPLPAGLPPRTVPCTFTSVVWKFILNANGGIDYEITISVGNAPNQIVSGTLTGVYGTVGENCPQLKLPWAGVATTRDGDRVPAHIERANGQICVGWIQMQANGWVPVQECGYVSKLSNLRQTLKLVSFGQNCTDNNLDVVVALRVL